MSTIKVSCIFIALMMIMTVSEQVSSAYDCTVVTDGNPQLIDCHPTACSSCSRVMNIWCAGDCDPCYPYCKYSSSHSTYINIGNQYDCKWEGPNCVCTWDDTGTVYQLYGCNCWTNP